MKKPLKAAFLLFLAALLIPATVSSSLPIQTQVPCLSAAGAFNPFDIQPVNPTEARAAEILAQMTLPEKVGQMFLTHCPESGAEDLIRSYHFGGLLLFASDFKDKTPAQVSAELQGYQDASDTPLLIGADEEGGTVNRVSKFPQYRPVPFESPQALYKKGGWALITSDTIEKARLLKSLGINLNLAPVCDVTGDPSAFIYPRTFGGDAALTAQYAETIAALMGAEQMGCVLKHFPGYGGSGDTHTGAAFDNRSLEAFTGGDFLPFAAGINAGAGAVLVSHTIVTCMDESMPASLSQPVHRVLRERLGFDGVIITDDLNMDAVSRFENTAVLAVLAGNDMLCCPNAERHIPKVIDAVQAGTIPEKMIDQAVLHILTWKLELGIIQ